jgi:hypothetical protein
MEGTSIHKLLSQLSTEVCVENMGCNGAFIADGGTALRLNGMWPYWMHENEGGVKNDIVLEDSMAVLSGPNMGGKSTALRSITAAALLANAGLPIPAGPGSQVPQVQTLTLATPFVFLLFWPVLLQLIALCIL